MNHKIISERVQFWKSSDSLRIEISQQVPKVKETMLFVWLMAWTFCGSAFIFNFFQLEEKSEKIFMAITIGFWSIFEFRIGKVFLWRRSGKEIIEITSDKLQIRNKIGSTGKTHKFNIQHVMQFGKASHKPNSFWAFMDNSYWSMGGDTLAFKFMGKEYQFGKQLNEKESQGLVHVVGKGIREFGKKSSSAE